jgi:hypothetical protein
MKYNALDILNQIKIIVKQGGFTQGGAKLHKV